MTSHFSEHTVEQAAQALPSSGACRVGGVSMEMAHTALFLPTVPPLHRAAPLQR